MFWSDERHQEVSLFLFLFDTTKFILLSVFTVEKTFCRKACSKSQLKSAKSPLSVDVRRSKRPCLNCLTLTELTWLPETQSVDIWKKCWAARRVTLLSEKGDPG